MKLLRISFSGALILMLALLASPVLAQPSGPHAQEKSQERMRHMHQMMERLNRIVERSHHLAQNLDHHLAQAQMEKTEVIRHMSELNSSMQTMAEQMRSNLAIYEKMLNNREALRDKGYRKSMGKLHNNYNDMLKQMEEQIKVIENLGKQLEARRPAGG
ncbi:MAG: hypothetical protein C4524_05615 [Candidatus Zixiibacteriota bacterium]|nr:MAG: hypothetical protein C4524_05615 [candidate division Zixibacteria bacterium]